MLGLTDKRADPAAEGPGVPGEGGQSALRTADPGEPINQIYEFGEYSHEISFLVDGVSPVRSELPEPWFSGPGGLIFALRPEGPAPTGSGDIGPRAITGGKPEAVIASDGARDMDFVASQNETIDRADAIFQEDTQFFHEDALIG